MKRSFKFLQIDIKTCSKNRTDCACWPADCRRIQLRDDLVESRFSLVCFFVVSLLLLVFALILFFVYDQWELVITSLLAFLVVNTINLKLYLDLCRHAKGILEKYPLD